MQTTDFPSMSNEPKSPRLVNPSMGLVASGIGKSFKGKRVVRNVSIRLARGEAVGLLGPNGAGKTTTFHIISGLLPADEGNVQLDGTDMTNMPVFQRARLGLGYLPQESSIFRGLTVEQNIRAVLETTDGSKSDHDAILDLGLRHSTPWSQTFSCRQIDIRSKHHSWKTNLHF